MLLTVPFSIWPGGALETFTDLYIKVLLIFMLMLNTLNSPARVRQFTWVLVIATSYVAFRAVFDYARGFNLIENGRVQGAVGGMFQNPNDLALNMVSVLPLAVLLAMRAVKPFSRLFAVAGAFLMIGAVIASQSRSGFLALGVMFVFLAWQVGRKRPSFIVALLVGLVLVLPLTPSSYWARMSSITDEKLDDTGSREARRILLREGYEAFLENPLTGVGAGLFKAYKPSGRVESWRETHNVVLQVASELGIFGLTAFMFLVYRAGFAGRAARQLLPRALGIQPKTRWGSAPPRGPAVISIADATFLEAHTATMAAAVAGWFFSALFASVAYNWTFYYLLALAIAPRVILSERLAAVSTPGRNAKRAALHEAHV
jgi:O-antigen ligase